MYIKFKSVTLHNFMSYGDATLYLDRGSFTLLQGYNNCVDDNARSNGSGKSSIWDALSWCLTGETIKGCKDVTRHNSDGGTLVQLDFNIDLTRYTLIRTKNHSKYKTNLKIFVNEEDKSGKGIKDSQEILNNLLPDITSSLLGSVIILGQGMPNKFSDNTPAGRKAVLEKLSKSDFMIDELKATVDARATQLSKDLRVASDESIKFTTLIDQKTDLKHKYEDNLTKIESININELRKEIIDTEVEIDRLTDELQSYQSDQEYFDKQIEENQTALQVMYDEYVKKTEHDSKSLKNQIYEAHKSVATAEAGITSTTNEINRLKNIKDVCPTCGQKLPNVIKPDTTQHEELLKSLQQQYLEFKGKEEYANNRLEDLRNTYRQEYNDNKRDIDRTINEFKQKKSTLQKQINDTNNEINRLTKYKNDVTISVNNVDKNINDIKSSIDVLNNEISDLNDKILYNKVTIENITNHEQVVTKMQTYLKRDFRGVLLANVISFINEKAKVYASQVFDTTKISITQDGNNVDIRYLDKDYSALSGGEQKKVDIIVQLAIREMLCTYLNFASNLFVLDEVFDSLDTLGCQKVIDLISNELKDAGTIFIVTHRADLNISCDDVVRVVKDASGVSTIMQK